MVHSILTCTSGDVAVLPKDKTNFFYPSRMHTAHILHTKKRNTVCGYPYSFAYCSSPTPLAVKMILTLALFLSPKERKMSRLVCSDLGKDETDVYEPDVFLQGFVVVRLPYSG